jgi:hypothetical protein
MQAFIARRRHRHSWIALSSCLVLFASPGVARAQPAADKAAADVLFNEGKKLIDKGDIAAACQKFEASLNRASQLGTQIALASCFEKQGRTASAWGAFRAASAMARKAGDKRARFCDERARAIEAMLSMLTIRVAAADPAGLAITRDGATVLAAELGTAVPVDPGAHTVEATAPGRVAWSRSVSVPPGPGVIEVSVPTLDKLPADPPPGVAPRPRRTLAYGLGGAGVAAIGGSLILGAMARSKWNDSRPHCEDRLCDPAGVELAGDARTLGNVSTVVFVAGTAAVATGVVLLLTGSRDNRETASPGTTALHLAPTITATQLGISLEGGF